MRICFFAPASSVHISKWCSYFISQGHETYVVSFSSGEIKGAKVYFVNSGISPDASDAHKIKYLLLANKVKKTMDIINPDIVSVHYATSYGTVAALAGLKGYVLSVWGSDIYSFPTKSFFHKSMLKYSLNKAPYLFSTSQMMAIEAKKYTDKHFYVTPFGVDMDLFNPNKRIRQTDDNMFVIGTVKGLSKAYGIDYLLMAVSIVHKKYPDLKLQLRIAGDGSDRELLKSMAKSLNLDEVVVWLGFISQQDAAFEWANMDIAVVYSSDNESFGVSAVEAQAAGCSLIISDAPGLIETTIPEVSSEVVERCNEKLLADKIEELIFDAEKRKRIGCEGRKYVLEKYEYNKCFSYIESICNDILNNKNT